MSPSIVIQSCDKAIQHNKQHITISISRAKADQVPSNYIRTKKGKPKKGKRHGSRVKKTLSERVHNDVTGVVMHRDLMSAYLSRFVNQDDTLSVQDAHNGYRGAAPRKVGGLAAV